MCKLSVIVPVYNVEKYIEKCARSLFEQTLEDIEYVFVDDCSPDNSIEILDAVCKEYPNRLNRIKILKHNQNKGLSVTRNTGLLEASGDYIICCDSDDFVDREAYEVMYDKAISISADIVACGVFVETEQGNILAEWLYDSTEEERRNLHILKNLEGGINSMLCNKMIRRDLLVRYNIQSSAKISMWEDFYVSIRLRYYANRYEIVNKPYYHYVQNPESICHGVSSKKIESQIFCAKKIEEFFQSIHENKEYSTTIAFIKFLSKEGLFSEQTINKWREIYPESHKYLWQFRSYYSIKKLCRYLSVICFGKAGWRLSDALAKIIH